MAIGGILLLLPYIFLVLRLRPAPGPFYFSVFVLVAWTFLPLIPRFVGGGSKQIKAHQRKHNSIALQSLARSPGSQPHSAAPAAKAFLGQQAVVGAANQTAYEAVYRPAGLSRDSNPVFRGLPGPAARVAPARFLIFAPASAKP